MTQAPIHKTKTRDNGWIDYDFETGATGLAIPCEGGYTHPDYPAMNKSRTNDLILADAVFASDENAARASVLSKAASRGSSSLLQGYMDFVAERAAEDGPTGYGN